MPRLPHAVAAVGLVLLLGTPLLVDGRAEPVTAIGELPARASASPPASSPPTGAATDRATAEVASVPQPAPVTLAIPTLAVRAEVVRVGLEDDGAMAVPEDVATVGWYALGVAPGGPGTAVIAGHVDGYDQGRGALFELSRLELDDEVVLTDAAGDTRAWRVTARRRYPKDALPVAELFVRGGTPRLALITCGGTFDRGTQSYTDNVVVLLEPRG